LNIQVKEAIRPTGWVGEMTRIYRPRKADDLADFAIEEQLQHAARSSRAKVLVFPEGAVRLWTDATDAFWAPAASDAGKTLLIGAGEPIPGSARYYNSVIIVGDHSRPTFHQRIPVPGGMWNPFQPQGGVALNLLGPGTMDVGGQRAAILICYEQLLTWPMLRSAAEKPTILIAISNESWTAGTTVPRVQHACVRAWARLFGLPVISAINS
jgi:apolipoprotein N-acyltransferase